MNKHLILVVGWLALAASACGSTDSGKSSGPGGSSNTADSAQLCEQQFDANETRCPVGESSKAANVEDCQRQQQGFAGIGCLAQFDSWLSCTTNPLYDCRTDSGCEG